MARSHVSSAAVLSPPSGVETLSPQEAQMVMASRRGDLAGTTPGIMQSPMGYHQRVIQAWNWYGTDPLFHRLIDRTIEYGANGSVWEVGQPQDATGNVQRTLAIETVTETRTLESDQEDEFWNVWADSVNMTAQNVLPGLDEVQRWAFRHMLLSGMFVMYYEIGKVKIGRREYYAPTMISCFPSSACTLHRKNSLFTSEQIYVTAPKLAQALKGEDPSGRPGSNIGVMEGEPRLATQTGYRPSAGFPLPPMSLDMAPDRNPSAMAGRREAYAVKYHWTPGDVITMGRPGQYATTGASVYPNVPFYSLTPQFVLRQKLFASDLAILDGVMQYIMWFKVGTKERPAKAAKGNQKSDVQLVREMIDENLYGPARAFYLPEWVNIELLMPKVETLLSEAKYFQSTIEIMQAFGVLSMRSTSNGRERMERINIANYQQFLADLQMHWSLAMRQLAWRIKRLNAGKLQRTPRWVPMPINTQDEKMREDLVTLAKLGRLSGQTLLRMFGLDDTAEFDRILAEQSRGQTDVWEENTPVAYRQAVVNPAGGTTTTSIPATLQQGRLPKGSARQPKPAKQAAAKRRPTA